MSNPFELIDARLATIENLLLDIKHPTPKPATDIVERVKDENFTIKQLSDYWQCHPQTIMKKKRAGLIPFHQSGRKVFFKRSEIDKVTAVPSAPCAQN